LTVPSHALARWTRDRNLTVLSAATPVATATAREAIRLLHPGFDIGGVYEHVREVEMVESGAEHFDLLINLDADA